MIEIMLFQDPATTGRRNGTLSLLKALIAAIAIVRFTRSFGSNASAANAQASSDACVSLARVSENERGHYIANGRICPAMDPLRDADGGMEKCRLYSREKWLPFANPDAVATSATVMPVSANRRRALSSLKAR